MYIELQMYFTYILLCGLVVPDTLSVEISRNLTSTLQPSTRAPRGRSYLDHRVLMPAPPACDVTAGRCDLQCCTDTDCSPHQRLSFSCPGEVRVAKPTSGWSCESRSASSPVWFPLLCFVKNNSPYLGLFFPPDSRTISDLNTFKKTAKRTYQFQTPTHSPKSKLRSEYRIGDPIRAFRFDTGEETTLKLPHGIGDDSTACIFRSSINFLEPRKSKCLQKITPEVCQSGELSIDRFVINDDVDFGVWVSIDGRRLTAVNTSTELLCHTEVASHLVSEFGVKSSQLRTKSAEYSRDFKLVPCIESSPVYDANTGLCHNVLVSLKHQVTWSGANITQIHTDFVLASLPVHVIYENSLKYMTRLFEVTFVHEPKQDLNLTNKDDLVQERSGKPGYNWEKPLVVGTLMWVNSSTENGSWHWEAGYARLWIPGTGGVCTSTRDLRFGHDVVTTCHVQLPEQLVSNCSAVRERMRDLLQSLVQGEHVAKQGDLEFEGLHAVVPILRLDNGESVTLVNSSGIEKSLNISVVENIPNNSSMDNNSSRSNRSAENTLCDVDQVTGVICTDVPTGLHFTVLHAQHEFSSVQVNNVLGLVIKLTHSNLSCESLHRVFVTTTVRFVPVHIQPTMSRFWLRMFEPSAVAWHSILTPFFEALKSGDATMQLLLLWSVLFGAFVMSSLLWALGSK